jgi:small GTP-binding protein
MTDHIRERKAVKVVFLGDSSVGKTSIIAAHLLGHFSMTGTPTIGASFREVTREWQGTPVRFSVWDTAGQEVYHSLAPMYYRTAACAVVVFDVSRADSFREANDWISELRSKVPGILIVVCGNKIDLEESRAVSYSDGANLAESLFAPYVETSARTGQGLEALFQEIVDRVGKSRPDLMRECRVLAQGQRAGGDGRRGNCC